MSNKDKMIVFMAITSLGSFGLGLWMLVSSLSLGALRAWAIASVLLIPLTGFISWKLGARDARAHLSGLDKGIDSVMKAADKTATLRTTGSSRPRRTIEVPRLPMPLIDHVSVNEDEVIDL